MMRRLGVFTYDAPRRRTRILAGLMIKDIVQPTMNAEIE
jgi:hypothetical protein